MRELGYAEGRNVSYEWRSAEGSYERLPQLAMELVQSKVDVIFAPTPPSVAAARRATSTIPIVMVAVGDPVALGFVNSLSRPGGNVTGVSNAINDVSRKYLELLRESLPRLSHVAMLVNRDNPNHQHIRGQVEATAKVMGIALATVEASTVAQLTEGFEAMRRSRPDALIVQGDGFFAAQGARISELALANRVPTMFWTRGPVDAGGLMSYGSDIAADYRKAATYVHRLLRGAKPAELPVEQPTRFEFVINLKTARAIDVRIPQSVQLRADDIIQ